MSLAQELARLVASRVGAQEAAWFAEALSLARMPRHRAGFATAFAGAGRRLKRSPVELHPEEERMVMAAGMERPPQGFCLDEVGRAALLLEALGQLPAEDHLALVAELYTKGEMREKQAVLRILPHLPAPGHFLDIAVEACRSHVQPVFEAIACDNPYPAAWFPEASFNQMVLKAIFTQIAVDRIVDLDRRITPDLVRMVEGYASERRAAGRAVPDDVARITSRLRRTS